jgi:D-3-phosphoglycerate dehydrogenase
MGQQGVNIEQQINTSRGDIAYTVLDLTEMADPEKFQADLCKACPGIISSRFILGKPGSNFYVKWAA